MSSDEFFQTTALAAELVEVPTAAASLPTSTPSLRHQPYPTQVSVPNSSNPLSSSAIKPSSRTKRKNPSEATPLQQLAETGADVEQKKPRRAAALSTSSACSGPSTSSTMISNPSSIAVTSVWPGPEALSLHNESSLPSIDRLLRCALDPKLQPLFWHSELKDALSMFGCGPSNLNFPPDIHNQKLSLEQLDLLKSAPSVHSSDSNQHNSVGRAIYQRQLRRWLSERHLRHQVQETRRSYVQAHAQIAQTFSSIYQIGHSLAQSTSAKTTSATIASASS